MIEFCRNLILWLYESFSSITFCGNAFKSATMSYFIVFLSDVLLGRFAKMKSILDVVRSRFPL